MDSSHQRAPKSTTTEQKKGHKGKRKDDASLKVVYISSPMKVRTSVSRFRSLVQELTGKNSDIEQYLDADGGGGGGEFHDDQGLMLPKRAAAYQVPSSICSDDTTTTSDSLVGPPAAMFASRLEEHFGGSFTSASFSEPSSQLDVLGAYDDLIM